MWWKCPDCNNPVDFENQLHEIFEADNEEAMFDPELGVWMHTIKCECGAYWVMGISPINLDKKEYDNDSRCKTLPISE
ncbi:hypothetical protein [Bacillus cereus]|uniref:hypothetical protein n=1 Tax=Bacillus thuringiensis TaxID=1428 RepID=UPI002DB930AB|nr:hypothetical protein [Bacillus cereus]